MQLTQCRNSLGRVATAQLSGMHLPRRFRNEDAASQRFLCALSWCLSKAKVTQLDFTEAEADILANDVELTDLAESFKASARGLIHR